MTKNMSNYKTRLCRHFLNGKCHLEDRCQFAHGLEELRGGGFSTIVHWGIERPSSESPKPDEARLETTITREPYMHISAKES